MTLGSRPRFTVQEITVPQYAVIDTRTGVVSMTEYGNKLLARERATAEEWARMLNTPFASLTGA